MGWGGGATMPVEEERRSFQALSAPHQPHKVAPIALKVCAALTRGIDSASCIAIPPPPPPTPRAMFPPQITHTQTDTHTTHPRHIPYSDHGKFRQRSGANPRVPEEGLKHKPPWTLPVSRLSQNAKQNPKTNIKSFRPKIRTHTTIRKRLQIQYVSAIGVRKSVTECCII